MDRLLWNNEEQSSSEEIVAREAVDPAHTWDLEALYPAPSAWEEDFDRIEELVTPLEALRGQLGSAENLARLFALQTELDRVLARLYSYAHLRQDEDLDQGENQARTNRFLAKRTEIGGRLAWITPEILSHSEEELQSWSEAEALADYHYEMVRLRRRKPHTLSEAEETLLSRASEVFAASRKTFGLLLDADLRFPHVQDSEGKERELSLGRYLTFLVNRDRSVRRQAFEAFLDTFASLKNTFTSTLSSQVKLQNYLASTRHFDSALEASLHEDNIPVKLYETLIAATHEALPLFYKYVTLRKKLLQLDDLDMYDVYVPIVPDYDLKVPFEQAKEWIIAACEPLGEEYVSTIKQAFHDRWIDIYENRGKHSGAYSAGCYDSLPYILLNYDNTLNHAFTLAHELGHSMHTWLANQNQPPHKADYPIFVAEIPSTLHEGLLLRYLLDTNEDPPFRAYLLNHFCDNFKGTVYRQTMFAEFEKIVHELDASGEPLTPDVLAETYYKLNTHFFGPDLKADERIRWEWLRIPHFYYNFYVYKYATSFCASQLFLQRVLEGNSPREQYLQLLKAGGSNDPLVLIEEAGVDLTDRQTLRSAFEVFSQTVDELDQALQALSA